MVIRIALEKKYKVVCKKRLYSHRVFTTKIKSFAKVAVVFYGNMVAVINFLEGKFGSGAIKMLEF